MTIVALRQWSVVGDPRTPYLATEHRSICLAGIPFGHPTMQDGKSIVTSPVAETDGRVVTTRSGSVYRLEGAPSDKFLAWLTERGETLDPERPIRPVRPGGR